MFPVVGGPGKSRAASSWHPGLRHSRPHLEDEPFCGLSIDSQDDVTGCSGPVPLCWPPWEEPLDPQKIIPEVAAALSLHLHETEPQTTGILSQFDLKLRTCIVGCEEISPSADHE